MEKRRILVVDSELSFLERIKQTLEAFYEVITASGKEEGLAKAQKEAPDLIIIGYLEPRGTSFAFHKELRGEPSTRDIPLLIIDVRPEEHSQKGWRREEGLQMEADDYITRPIESAELKETVEAILQRASKKPRELREVLEHMEGALRRIDRIEKMLLR